MLSTLKRLMREEKGQGMAEYGLILTFVAIVCIVAFTNLGHAVSSQIGIVVTSL